MTHAIVGMHTAAFRDATALPQAEEAMEKGACILALTALRTFNDEAFRNKVYAEFQEQVEKKVNGFFYERKTYEQ